ncbi:MAG: flagellar hook protein FlgE [Cycloclasticus sp.]|nr:flagellar hook protein FlgE [Cycloclasticus sp.]
MSFRTSLSGLNASAADLSVKGNNIANASTNGFKQSRTEFASVFATSFTGGSNTPGSGVRVSSISQQYSQGIVESTSNSLDLAISKDGFFVLDDGGTTAYTRAGAFITDKDGFVVDSSGRQLQVFPASYVGGVFNSFNTGSLSSLQLSTTDSAPQATTSITPVLNLNADEVIPGGYTAIPPAAINPTEFSRTSADTFNHTTSTEVYDAQGKSYQASMYYVASDPSANEWQVHTFVGNDPLTLNGTADSFFTMTFDGLGAISGVSTATGGAGTVSDVNFDALTIVGSGSAPLDLSFDYTGTSQFGSDFAVNGLNQDGFASGRLSGIDIDGDGSVSATFTNGRATILGQVALAKFPNNNGLRQLGDTSWAQTFEAGDRVIGAPGTASFGNIRSNALEASNVDIATELVGLITAQRNFQANAQAISTESEIQTAIMNIR